MSARIIAVMSPKGGVGKTTVSVNLSSAIGTLKKKIAGKTSLNPLYTTSDDEIRDLLIIHGEKTAEKKRTGFDRDILNMISDVEKRRPGGMISLVKMGARLGVI